MTNIYWPIYKNLESAVTRLTYAIYVNDSQLNVYSSDISDLILRASAEIESISKELYKTNGGLKIDKIKYDSDALEHLNQLWSLDKKVVIISSINCFQSLKELRPFVKNELSSFHGKSTFSWNNSYQNLKHDRAKSLEFGSIKYLFDIMAALFLLNIYLKDENYPLGNDDRAINFPLNMGSSLFSIKIQRLSGYTYGGDYAREDDFDECVYAVRYLDSFRAYYDKAHSDMHQREVKLFSQHPKVIEYFANRNPQENTPTGHDMNKLLFSIVGQDDYYAIGQMAMEDFLKIRTEGNHQAVLNKNV